MLSEGLVQWLLRARAAVLALRTPYAMWSINVMMVSHPGLNCIPKQPTGQSGHRLPLHVRPTPYSRVEAPLCFKIILVYLYIRVLSYLKMRSHCALAHWGNVVLLVVLFNQK